MMTPGARASDSLLGYPARTVCRAGPCRAITTSGDRTPPAPGGSARGRGDGGPGPVMIMSS
eukprot:607621-Hanusia_phi.AAC.1